MKTVDSSEVAANRYSLKCAVMMTVIMALTSVFDLSGIFIVEGRLVYISFALGVLCTIIIALIVHYIGDRTISKYLLLFWIVVYVTILGVFLTYHTLLFCMVPLLLSAQYKDKRVIYYAYGLSLISMIVAALGGYFYGLCDANMLVLTTADRNDYIDAAGKLLFDNINDNPWLTLPIYFVFPRVLLMFVFVPVILHISNVISDNACREMELKRLGETDTMTQFYDRNKYTQMIGDYYPSVENVGVIFWDVNRLKYVNDTYGHEYGDFLISTIASSIQECIGDNATAYRVGGDELLVIMENPKAQEVAELMQACRDNIVKKDKISRVPISAASGYAFGNGKDIKLVVSEADSNMYEDKKRYHMSVSEK